MALLATPVNAQVPRAVAAPSDNTGCLPGQFLVRQRGGECWECPAGFIRSSAPVLSRSACARPKAVGAKQHARGAGLTGTQCGPGQFWNPDGWCYSCPEGFARSQAAVASPRACVRTGAVAYAAAKYMGKAL